jgi:hypothetical protein
MKQAKVPLEVDSFSNSTLPINRGLSVGIHPTNCELLPLFLLIYKLVINKDIFTCVSLHFYQL